jgi:hypothetical protein
MRALAPFSLALAVALTLPASALADTAAEAPIATQPTHPPAPPKAPDDPETRYQSLVAAAKETAPNADWTALRLAYAARPDFHPFAESQARQRMFVAMAANDCASALGDARSLMDDDYVDPDAHFVAAYCEEKAGDARASEFDRDIGAGLIASIETGDGLSPASAFTVISAAEEASLLRARGLAANGQSRLSQGGHAYDAIRALDAKGQTQTYYFQVDRLVAAPPALAPGDVSEGGPPSRSP